MIVWLAVLTSSVGAQGTQVTITIEVPRVRIEITSNTKSKEWSFRNSYAGALGLGERVEGLATKESNIQKLATGEFQSAQAVSEVHYVVRLDQVRTGDLAHVSWLSGDYGFLMLADLLPEAVLKQPTVRLKFQLPSGWSALTSVEDKNEEFVLNSPDEQVFFLGKNLRRLDDRNKKLQMVIHGDWKFKDRDARKSAEKVFESYLDLTRFTPPRPVTIFIAPIPTSETSSQWKAETRGSTVVLLINQQANFLNWVGQLGVIFTHELFHVWIPNSLKLEGSYDWFFEGFTLYVALQSALKLNLIKFDEYLATIARVYDSYLSYTDSQSLLDASASRWTNSGSLVYDKGMLVALLYDLTLRLETGGSDTLKAKYQSLLSRLVGKSTDANEAIIGSMGSSAATRQIFTSYVEEPRRIELPLSLAPFGIDVVVGNSKSELKVRKELTPGQLKLLKSLGYRR